MKVYYDKDADPGKLKGKARRAMRTPTIFAIQAST